METFLRFLQTCDPERLGWLIVSALIAFTSFCNSMATAFRKRPPVYNNCVFNDDSGTPTDN